MKTIHEGSCGLAEPELRQQVEGYEIGGKTGTAEKLPRGEGNYLLSFIGYAPQENPEVVIYVVIDEPNVANQSVSSYVTGTVAEDHGAGVSLSEYHDDQKSATVSDREDNGSSQDDITDYDENYEDTYSNDAGYYGDERDLRPGSIPTGR